MRDAAMGFGVFNRADDSGLRVVPTRVSNARCPRRRRVASIASNRELGGDSLIFFKAQRGHRGVSLKAEDTDGSASSIEVNNARRI